MYPLPLKDILHPDISYQNVLPNVFDLESVIIKLSDFGSAKEQFLEFTRTDTEIRGTIINPQLEDQAFGSSRRHRKELARHAKLRNTTKRR